MSAWLGSGSGFGLRVGVYVRVRVRIRIRVRARVRARARVSVSVRARARVSVSVRARASARARARVTARARVSHLGRAQRGGVAAALEATEVGATPLVLVEIVEREVEREERACTHTHVENIECITTTTTCMRQQGSWVYRCSACTSYVACRASGRVSGRVSG